MDGSVQVGRLWKRLHVGFFPLFPETVNKVIALSDHLRRFCVVCFTKRKRKNGAGQAESNC